RSTLPKILFAMTKSRHSERSEGAHNKKRFFGRALPQNDGKLIPAPGGRGSKGVGVTLDKIRSSGSIQFDENTLRDKPILIDSGSEPGMTKYNPPRNQRIDSFPRPWWDTSRTGEGTSRVSLRAEWLREGQKPAFTLAEVLITLGIIGVVAAMTIPTLNDKIRVRQTVIKLRTVQSVFSQAVKLAVADNGDLDGLDLGTEDTQVGSEKLYNVLKPYLKNAQDCGKQQGCFKNDYLALNGKTKWMWQPGQHAVYARGVLLNGIQYAVWSAGSGCRNGTHCGVIFVDINGNTKPNRAGVDYFKFIITKNNIIPAKGNSIIKYGDRCAYNDNDSRNGADCTAWVIEKENMDYLKKPISW
ncbi:MAG: type II secretion system GspH family protein, partial [Muribaculaceae bacterium]|nr:type II secretion system GspH family protein [Muribaculaceae bacterium]